MTLRHLFKLRNLALFFSTAFIIYSVSFSLDSYTLSVSTALRSGIVLLVAQFLCTYKAGLDLKCDSKKEFTSTQKALYLSGHLNSSDDSRNTDTVNKFIKRYKGTKFGIVVPFAPLIFFVLGASLFIFGNDKGYGLLLAFVSIAITVNLIPYGAAIKELNEQNESDLVDNK
ncbi:hypothetical protein EIJ81_00465 (plasmid) [Aliivibrio salmonicida]|uniref:hypothetical protein n=1 Tax=Aliivibrio salmonicida TaxID=40269 RepID=UPI000F6E2A14|nr:hypothetical protein [Aliivibrio salmonicida]AZL83372.1 hypothetical protein EIJ81_00465 [Aliivibrio salmonicida]